MGKRTVIAKMGGQVSMYLAVAKEKEMP